MGYVEKVGPWQANFAQFCKCLVKTLLRPTFGVTRHRAVVNDSPLVIEMREEELVIRSAFA